MLEHTRLRLHPWVCGTAAAWAHAEAAVAASVCAITDPATQERLGFASVAALPRWLSFLGMKTIRVFENQDACLLMTLHRPCGVFRMWQVRDAEENTVGAIYRDTLLDAGGRRLAHMAHAPEASENVLLSGTGIEMASWQRISPHESILQFAENGAMNPFARMLALATCLLLPPLPT